MANSGFVSEIPSPHSKKQNLDSLHQGVARTFLNLQKMYFSHLAVAFRPKFLVFMNDLASNFDASKQSQFYEFFLTIKHDKNQFEREFSMFFHEYITDFPNGDYDFDLESDIQEKFKNKHTLIQSLCRLPKPVLINLCFV